MKVHIALVRQAGRDPLDNMPVVLLQSYEGISKDSRSFSRCGNFYTWGDDYIFASDVMEVDIPESEDTEYEITRLEEQERKIKDEYYARMEEKLDPIKARKLTLTQLEYFP